MIGAASSLHILDRNLYVAWCFPVEKDAAGTLDFSLR